MNVPQLRFSEFDGEWRNISLGEVLKESKEVKSGKSNLPIATSSRKGLFLQSDYFNGKRSYDTDEINFKVVPRGYVTYRHMSDDSTFHFNINQLADEILVSPEYPVFTTSKGADIQFILYHLNSHGNFKNFCIMQKLGGTRTRLYFKKLQNYKLFIPSIEEQQKISTFLQLLNKRIEKQEEKIEKLEQYKKGMMQKIFSQELRFKDEDGGEFPEWHEKPLPEIIEVIDGDRGKNYPSKSDFLEEGYCLFLNTKNVTKNGFNFINKSFITKEKHESMRKGTLKRNDIVMTSRGSIGNVVLYDHTIPFEVVRINSAMLIIRLKDEDLNIAFFEQLLKSRVIKNFVDTSSVGSAQPHITVKDLNRVRVSIPSNVTEQKKIANISKRFELKIEKEKEKLMVLEEQKRGFMQGMFV
ncbi:restriction endonuclease subunit S [Planococcus salinus]|uniref:Restriction endonuclease subunit S n=1 Tax=Planococcus salinus TaxID=1848460 RepID=A0A3M8P5B5_9BACL|nr:restriction endonuclease subunit S [Planococcus salinus]RNF38876.1 restriction endonuclease subunit S [Planococcus salinus]